MSFKTKNRKKLVSDTRVTLHAKHEAKLQYFIEKEKKGTIIKEDINVLEKRLETLKNCTELNESDIEKKMQLIDQINNLKNELEITESKTEEIDYLLDTGKLLFNYANNDKKVDKKDRVQTHINNSSNKKKSVMDYFGAKVNLTKQKEVEKSDIEDSVQYKSKAKLYEDYLLLTDENFDNLNIEKSKSIDFCEYCNIEKTLYMSEGKMICSKCGDETFILLDSDKPSYKEPPREISYFAYKRINHFNEWLAQFQAKESTDIPQEVYNQIISELKKERIEDMKTLTPQKLREILKKLKKNKYYEHVPHIINRLNGEPPPTISREIEEELRRMFKEIQIPFHKFCPKNRKNFLSYSYVLHKFVQLLELDEFTECFILLKSREKLHQQDQIWKQICEYLKWEYIPSV